MKFSLVLAVAAWLAAVTGFMGLLFAYSNAPGQSGGHPSRWPAESRISLAGGRSNVIVFAHPHCPCTRATLAELATLMARCQGRLGAQVWFVRPTGVAEDWTATELGREAAVIPGVTVHCDDGMEEALRFGAETSGQTLLYGGDGRLLFHGGITLARGHVGENPGGNAVIALSAHPSGLPIETPVFGCPLANETCREGDTGCKP